MRKLFEITIKKSNTDFNNNNFDWSFQIGEAWIFIVMNGWVWLWLFVIREFLTK